MGEAMKGASPWAYGLGHWMLLFYLYSFAGWCWEVALYLVRRRRFVNRGFLSGPLLPIYGFGAAVILMCCLPVAGSPLLVALIGAGAATLLELVSGWLMEALFHVRYWDYSDCAMNLRGYICLSATATWALFSVLVVRILHPWLMPWVLRVPPAAALGLCGALTLFALGDTAVSVRRALDLRAVLMWLELHGAELDALAGVMSEGAQTPQLARVRRQLRRAHRALRANPGAVSRRYSGSLALLRAQQDSEDAARRKRRQRGNP